ncbi:MAG: hypothetical protein CVU02_02550 [Bacteroidetes bacterium HGW-Bacteroidetes-19]|nr:MAG: hypothetical protein CVU02_02550 [Bacteroidetes bacterium HGW-Bacteroidetes-19]
MKNFLLIIVSIVLIFKIDAQSIQWGPTIKTNYVLHTDLSTHTGDYLGEINGFEYYAYYDMIKWEGKLRSTYFLFYETKGTTLSNFSDFGKHSYDLIGVTSSNSKICITHLSTETKKNKEIKIDFYNPKTFQLENSSSLISFYTVGKNEPFIRFVQSENKEYNLFLVYGKDAETDEKGLIITCFNKDYELVWRNIYSPNEEWNGSIGDIYITNTGKALLHFLDYNDPKSNNIKTFHFSEIYDQEISEISQELETPIKIIDYKLGDYSNGKYLFVYSDATNVYGSTVDFKTKSTKDILNQKTYTGKWKIDKIADLKNGKFTIAIQNRDVTTITVKGGGSSSNKYFSWNRSFIFIGINGENDDITFSKKLRRNYNHMQFWEPAKLQLLIEPFYFVKDGNLHLVYNTERKTEESVSNSDENPSYFYYYRARTTVKPLTKMVTISEDGKLKVRTIMDSKEEKGTCLSKFLHLDANNDLIIAKSIKKKATFGIVKL